MIGQDVVVSSVAGQPVVYGTAAVVVALFALPATQPYVLSLATIAREGGYLTMALLTGRRSQLHFQITESGSGTPTWRPSQWGAGNILIRTIGPLTPSLLGLGGAFLLLEGKIWSILWATIVLLFGALFLAAGWMTQLIVLLAIIGIGWVAVAGSVELQIAVAVGLIWILLIGGMIRLHDMSRDPESTPGWLSHDTWIPQIAWFALWWFVAIICLIAASGRLLDL